MPVPLFARFSSHPLTFPVADHDFDGRFDRDGVRRFRWHQWFLSNLIEDLFPMDRHGSRCTDAEADLPAGLHAEHGDRHFIADAHRFPDPSSQDQNRSSLLVGAVIGPSMSDATRWNIKSCLRWADHANAL
jgi:hypothetical protein